MPGSRAYWNSRVAGALSVTRSAPSIFRRVSVFANPMIRVPVEMSEGFDGIVKGFGRIPEMAGWAPLQPSGNKGC